MKKLKEKKLKRYVVRVIKSEVQEFELSAKNKKQVEENVNYIVKSTAILKTVPVKTYQDNKIEIIINKNK